MEDREVLARCGGVEQVRVPGQRADAELAVVFFYEGEFGQAVDVDQYAGLGQPQLHHRDEAVAAGQHAVVRPAQQRQRMLDAGRALILDMGRHLHSKQIKASLIRGRVRQVAIFRQFWSSSRPKGVLGGEPASAEVSRYRTSSTRSVNFHPSGVRW